MTKSSPSSNISFGSCSLDSIHVCRMNISTLHAKKDYSNANSAHNNIDIPKIHIFDIDRVDVDDINAKLHNDRLSFSWRGSHLCNHISILILLNVHFFEILRLSPDNRQPTSSQQPIITTGNWIGGAPLDYLKRYADGRSHNVYTAALVVNQY